ncbi:MAG: hypothetical protein M0D55_16850 [Elusimicrobiota bacterium]|nr:MAG: hypothetical protein M0D55_16850 [Elusimicrobiota bacterium]
MVGARIAALARLAVGREPDVVELDLVEARGGRARGDVHRVLPDLLLVRVDPGGALVVGPDAAVREVDREVGAGAREMVVLEDRHARDRVDAEVLEILDGPRKIGDRVDESARLLGERHSAHELMAVVVLERDDDGVEARGLHLAGEAAAGLGRARGPAGEMDSFKGGDRRIGAGRVGGGGV